MGLIYNGGVMAQSCPSALDPTNYSGGSWFGYNDGTSDSGTFVHSAQPGGADCDPAHPCAFHTSGQGYTNYGAGVGFQILSGTPAPAFDASRYGGLQVWFKGFTKGTRTFSYAQQDNTVHVKFLTLQLPDGGDPRHNDDFGYYCSTVDNDGGTSSWVVCPIPFSALKRDGFAGADSGAPDPSTDQFDPQNLIKIQFEISSFTPPADSGTTNVVSFDIWIDYIAWMPLSANTQPEPQPEPVPEAGPGQPD
jgi:hypothetical protein